MIFLEENHILPVRGNQAGYNLFKAVPISWSMEKFSILHECIICTYLYK